MQCKGCREEVEGQFSLHCDGHCGWVICSNCSATSDMLSKHPEAFFAKKPRSPEQAG